MSQEENAIASAPRPRLSVPGYTRQSYTLILSNKGLLLCPSWIPFLVLALA